VQGEQQAPTSVEIVELPDDTGPSTTRDSMDLPIALRKATRAEARKPPNWYREEHDIANYIIYISIYELHGLHRIIAICSDPKRL
jgi:hypothetical protein